MLLLVLLILAVVAAALDTQAVQQLVLTVDQVL
jgi:hypothetical protein